MLSDHSTRRRFVALAVATIGVGLAGCTENGEDTDEDDGDDGRGYGSIEEYGDP